MNLKMRLILALLAIILSNAMVSAKLTIAYAQIKNNIDVSDITVAKVRQAMIELYGEEWLKDHLKKTINPPKGYRVTTYIGDNNQLILDGGPIWNEELLMMTKKAFDLLSVRNDTIYIPVFNQIPAQPINESEKEINFILKRLTVGNDRKTNRLYVGDVFEKDTAFLLYWFCLCSNNLYSDYEYRQACKEKGYTCLFFDYRKEVDCDTVKQEDIDLAFDYIMKSDKKWINYKITDPIQISKYSYEYSKDAEIRFVEEKILHD